MDHLQDPTSPDTEAIAQDEASVLRVLIIEDDAFTLTILKKRLLQGGYEVRTATNGVEGWEVYEAFKPHLVLSDWMMPEMDGRELCRKIKQNPNGHPVYFILLTARDKHDDIVTALDTGADEYLVKPCEGTELMARMRAAERILRLQRELTHSNRHLQRAMKRINQELQASSEIQRSLLPQGLPQREGYAFAAHYQPSYECSGDFYDLLPLEDGRLCLTIGDVSGHGTPAMVAMAVTHTLLHQEIRRFSDPAGLLARINTLMFQRLPTGQYATMFVGVLEPETGRLIYSSAGHNPPLQVDHADRRATFLPNCEGFPIKLVDPEADYQNYECRIEPGQSLVMYTDGILDGVNPESDRFGAERLKQLLEEIPCQDPRQIIELMMTRLKLFMKGGDLADDLSILAVCRE